MTRAITIAGVSLELEERGEGRPLLFLHPGDGLEPRHEWLDLLARRYRVIAPVHPGWGNSAVPAWLSTVDDLAYLYLDLAAALPLEDAVLVGACFGGWIAAEMAVRSTAALNSLVLIAPAGIHVKGVQKGDIFLWSAQETAYNLFHDPELAKSLLAKEPTDAEIDVMLKNNLMTAKLTWQPRMYNPHLYKWLHRIDVPVQIVWGAQDKVIPVQYADAFAKLRLRLPAIMGIVSCRSGATRSSTFAGRPRRSEPKMSASPGAKRASL